VLELGIRDYIEYRGARDREQMKIAQDVEEWIEDRDTSWLFSFENICHVLDLEPDYLRRGLRAQKERARSGEKAEPEVATLEDNRERMRATSG
jgi:hypothetical protein